MARLVGVDLPREKRLEIALTYIYGIGRTRADEILSATGISPDLRVKDLTDEQLVPLRDYIEAHFKIEGDLRREVQADIRRKVELVHTKVSVIVVDYLSVDNVPTPMPVPVKVQRRPWLERRRSLSNLAA